MKLESTVFENVDLDTGEIIYELWLHDYGNLSSQLLNIATTFKTKKELNELSEKMNFVFSNGGY